MSHNFRKRLKNHETLIGPMVTLGSSTVADILSRVGFDYLWMDLEHTATDLGLLLQMMQASNHRVPCLVRPPVNDEIWIKRILDIGCDGLIIPNVQNAQEAKKAVASCKYPPSGIRGVGVGRAQAYGMELTEHLANADDQLAIILQAEHFEAVRNIESILDVPGIDAIYIGPYDLSASMGKVGQLKDTEVLNAIQTIKSACKNRSIPLAIMTMDATIAKAELESGVSMVTLGIDAVYLWKFATQLLQDVRS